MTYHTGSWIAAKFAGACWRCRAAIIRGDTVKYLPQHRRILCRGCGERAEQHNAA